MNLNIVVMVYCLKFIVNSTEWSEKFGVVKWSAWSVWVIENLYWQTVKQLGTVYIDFSKAWVLKWRELVRSAKPDACSIFEKGDDWCISINFLNKLHRISFKRDPQFCINTLSHMPNWHPLHLEYNRRRTGRDIDACKLILKTPCLDLKSSNQSSELLNKIITTSASLIFHTTALLLHRPFSSPSNRKPKKVRLMAVLHRVPHTLTLITCVN